MLKSTSGTEPPPLPHTHVAAPVKSKVAPRLTALQGVDYHSTARTVYLSHHRGGHRRRTGHRTVVDTLYVVITAQVPLHIFSEHEPSEGSSILATKWVKVSLEMWIKSKRHCH